ncbi:alpha/beta fold hydrolase [Arhodomonas sp. AD133]|uniref:alpha/beta fold hydrolase n=1 Tax=Arhodomonas sp. AD133 TaxID=3415009 RepID=UPI003EBAD127
MHESSTWIDPTWTPRSRWVDLRGWRYRLHEWPAREGAPTAVLLHGWMDTGAGFGPLAAALGPQWRCLAPDWRGFGESDRAPQGRYWFPDYLADLDALLDTCVADDERVTLIGHSMGGNVAGLYAGVRPKRVRALVSLEGFGLRGSDPTQAPARYRDWLDSLGESPRLRCFPSFAALAEHLQARNPHLNEATAAYLARCWGREADGDIRLLGDSAHRRPNPVLYRLDEAMACWQAVTAPTLWVWGEDSTIARMLRGSDDWQARLACFRDLHTAAVANAGHGLHQEQPRAVADAIDAFARTAL